MEKFRIGKADGPQLTGRSALGYCCETAATDLARSRIIRVEGISGFGSEDFWRNLSRRENFACTALEKDIQGVRLLNLRGRRTPLYTPHQAANELSLHERVNKIYMLISKIRNKGDNSGITHL